MELCNKKYNNLPALSMEWKVVESQANKKYVKVRILAQQPRVSSEIPRVWSPMTTVKKEWTNISEIVDKLQ